MKKIFLFCFLFILAISDRTFGANVTKDGSAYSNSGTGSSLAVACTTGSGTNRLMLVGVSVNCYTGTQTISSVTFTPSGGSALALTNVITKTHNAANRISAIYSILSPSTTSKAGTVTVTLSASTSYGIVAGVINFAGVDQTTPLGTAVFDTGSYSTHGAPTVALTGLNGDELVFDNVFKGSNGSASLTVGGSQTQQWNTYLSNCIGAASIQQATTSSVTMTWSVTSDANAGYYVTVAVPIKPAAAARYSVATGNWSSTATWSATSGGAAGASVPVAGDNVTIEGGHNVTLTADAACATVSFTTATATSLTLGTYTLAVSGAITIPRSGSGINLIAVGAGTLSAGSVAFTTGGTTMRHEITISTGTVTVSGDITTNNTGASATVAFTDAGLLQVGVGLLTTTIVGGTLTPSTGTVQFNAAGAQTVHAFTYNNLTLSGSGAKSLSATATVNGTLSMQGTATATGTTPTYGASAILEYKGSAAQTVSTTEFPAAMGADVIIDNASGVTIGAGKTLTGNLTLTAGTLAAGTNLTMGSGPFLITRSEGSMTGTLQGTNAYDVTYTGNSKTTGPELNNGGLRNVTVNLTAGQTLTLDATRTPDGNLSVSAGTLDLSSFTISRSAAGGTLTVSNGATLKIGGTNSFPANYSTASVGTTSTVEYSGTTQTIENGTGTPSFSYGNLTTSGSGTKTLETSGGSMTINGNLTIGSGTTLASNDKTITLVGNWQNSGTFTQGSSTLIMGGSSAQTMSGSTFNNLTINNAAGVTMQTDETVNGTLTLTSGTLTVGAHTLTIGGSSMTRTSGNISVIGGTVAFTNTSALTLPASVFTGNVYNLTMNGAGGVTLGSAVIVSHTLTLTSGNLTTTTTNLLTLSGSSASASGGSSSSFVYGPLTEDVTSTTKFFPVGKGAAYRPVTLNVSISSSPVIRAEVFNSGTSGTPGSGLTALSSVRYWQLAVTSGTVTSTTVNLTYGSDDGVTDNTHLRVGYCASQGGTYNNLGGSGSANGSGNITSNSTSLPYYFTLANATGGTNPLPVELASFTASARGSSVDLKWSTATEVDNYGFDVERIAVSASDGWRKIAFVEGHGTSNAPLQYAYADKSVTAGKYDYRLKQIDRDGNFKYYDQIEVAVSAPTAYGMDQNYPNPFNPSTSISFSLPAASDVTLKVYNMLGQEVATLVSGKLEAGMHSAVWTPGELASGLYVYRLHASDGSHSFVATKKLMFIK